MFTRRDFLATVSAAGALAIAGCQTTPSHPATTSGSASTGSRSIDRTAVIARHDPRTRSLDPMAVLSVGNGAFAFNVDATGLQSLSAVYTKIPLCTLAHWGWHTFPRPASVDPAKFRYKMYDTYGRPVPYATSSTGQKELYNYLRENPHKFHLGRLALLLDGKPLDAAQITKIDQHLDLYAGIITSRFLLAGAPVEVITACHPKIDAVATRITSPLASAGRLALQVLFPYASSGISAADFNAAGKHQSRLVVSATDLARIERKLDAMTYSTRLAWRGAGLLQQAADHDFRLVPSAGTLEVVAAFDESQQLGPLPPVAEVLQASTRRWNDYWNSGAALDLGDCTDTRAPELERRIVLSQYITAIHCAGPLPSAETGLLCNSWYGKFHLEMHFWHSTHFAQWNRFDHFSRTLPLYEKILASSVDRARFQGYAGARWPEMIGPDGNDSPSPIGPLLIWQQPHPILYAELCWRHAPTRETLDRWKAVVAHTANFMASFAHYIDARGQFVLGPPMKTVPENADALTTINPTWELTSWRLGLKTALAWFKRLGETPTGAGGGPARWAEVLAKLSSPSALDGAYLMQENEPDTYTRWNWEHPSVCGALGVLPGDGIDAPTMRATVQKVAKTWQWSRVWGWDFPTMAMCAGRCGLPELAIDMLMMDAPMNRYPPNGANFQRDNVPAYYPANGGLLLAAAMLSAGSDAAPGSKWPRNGKWNVRHEAFPRWL